MGNAQLGDGNARRAAMTRAQHTARIVQAAKRAYMARTPPSTWISEPVMYDDSSEARNKMAYATS
jgi:hypothetical protein